MVSSLLSGNKPSLDFTPPFQLWPRFFASLYGKASQKSCHQSLPPDFLLLFSLKPSLIRLCPSPPPLPCNVKVTNDPFGAKSKSGFSPHFDTNTDAEGYSLFTWLQATTPSGPLPFIWWLLVSLFGCSSSI